MNFNFYYINLSKRPERHKLFIENWDKYGYCFRIDAIDMSNYKRGTLGCYLSHKKAFEAVSKSPVFNDVHIICEDDAVPCSDFLERWKIISKELPKDWDVLMLGYSISKNSKYSFKTEHIARAEKFIQAGHCYVINQRFMHIMHGLHNRIEDPFDNFDLMLRYLQDNHNVYMAIPAFAYQYSSYSDNSNRLVGNTDMTETLFKDRL